MSTPFKLKGHTLPGPNQAAPLKQTTEPPKVTYRRNIFTGNKKVKTYTAPGGGTKYYYDRKGNVKKTKEEGKTTKIKKGYRAPRGQNPEDYN